MKTVKTKPDCTLIFSKKGESGGHPLPMDVSSFTMINLLSEITEEQAKELVEEAGDYAFKSYGQIPFISPRLYNTDTEITKLLRAVHSLQSAAMSVGIEEKDFGSYLVIKL